MKSKELESLDLEAREGLIGQPRSGVADPLPLFSWGGGGGGGGGERGGRGGKGFAMPD